MPVTAFQDRQIVVTGAAGGIGSLVSAHLAAAGATVIGVDRADCPACNETLLADLSTEATLAELCTDLARRRVDILVNLAGIQNFGPLVEQRPADIRLGFAVNLIAPVTLARAVLPQMLDRGTGHIVNIGSVMGSIAYPHFAAYSSSKAGLRGFSEALRRELHGLGIAITHIAPRAARTGFNDSRVSRFLAMTKMKVDEPDTVARAIIAAIAGRKKDVVIGAAESFLIAANALAPRLIDAGLARQTTGARTLFTS